MRDGSRGIDVVIANIGIGVQGERRAVYVLCLSELVVRLNLADRRRQCYPATYQQRSCHQRK